MKQQTKAAQAALLAGIFALGAGVPAHAQLQFRTSWLGNSFGKDVSGKWVQNNVGGLWVASDGTCYTNSRWDEGHREGGIYKGGDYIGNLPDLHTSGSDEVAGNATHVFLNAGSPAQEIRRYNRSNNSRSSWASGTGTTNSVNVGGTIRGLAVDSANGLLYSADESGSSGSDGEIRVYNASTMAFVRAWNVPKPRRLAIAPDGSVWVASAGSGTEPVEILHYSATGTLLTQKIVGGSGNPGFNPAALAFDGGGRLLVADNGPHQQVKIYTNLSNTSPTLSATLGAQGGIFSGTAGAVAPLKFNFITGLGADSSGNIYVGQNRFGVGTNSYAGPGSILESYTATGTRNWVLRSLEFCSIGDFTPGSDGAEVYSNLGKYTLNLGATTPGGEATYAAHTLNPFKYPDDERWKRRDNNFDWVTGFVMRTLGGQKFQFQNAMWGDRLGVLRFNSATDGEIGIPCAEVNKQSGTEGYSVFWRDLDGDGARDSNEFTTSPRTANAKDAESHWIDADGNLWQAIVSAGTNYGGIRRFAFLGLDARGIPQWDVANPTFVSLPAPFNQLRRAIYDKASDTMYLAGYSNAGSTIPARNLVPEHGIGTNGWDGKAIGSVIACFRGWSGGNRTPNWVQTIPDVLESPNAWAIAGNFMFIGYACDQYDIDNGHVQIRRLSDGVHLGRFWAGPNNTGRVDIEAGVSAMRRSNGEYLVLSEDNWYARIMLWRWTPPASAPVAPTLSATNGNSHAKLSWTGSSAAALYELYRGTTSGGPYTRIYRGDATSFTDTNEGLGLTNGTAYHYVVKAIGPAGDSPNSAQRTVTPSGLLALKIDSGTSEETGDWIGDTFVSGGNALETGGDSTTNTLNPAPAAIYQTTRRQGDPITYTFRNQSANTNYTVRLHFGEWWHNAGGRTFNIVINGVVREANLDVAAITGGKNRALTREWSGITRDANGNIVVQITKGTETMIDGVELIPPAATTVTTNLSAIADNFVRDGSYGDTNYGSDALLDVKNVTTAGSTRWAYLKFDTTGLGTVTSAKIRLSGNLSSTNPASLSVAAYGVQLVSTADWSESTLTWNNKPASGTTALATTSVGGTSANFYEWDVTSFVQSEASAGRRKVGFALKNVTQNTDALFRFSSKEGTNDPVLVVEAAP